MKELAKDCDKLKDINVRGCDPMLQEAIGEFFAHGCEPPPRQGPQHRGGPSLFQSRPAAADDYDDMGGPPDCIAKEYYEFFPDGHASMKELAKDCDKLKDINVRGCDPLLQEAIGEFFAHGCKPPPRQGPQHRGGPSLFQSRPAAADDYDDMGGPPDCIAKEY